MKIIREYFSTFIILTLLLTCSKAENNTRCRTFTQQCNKVSKCCEGLLCKKLPNHYKMCFRDPNVETTTETILHFDESIYSSEFQENEEENGHQNDTNIDIYRNSVKENGNIILNQEEIVFKSNLQKSNQNQTGSEENLVLDEVENSHITQDNEFETENSQNTKDFKFQPEAQINNFNDERPDSKFDDFDLEISKNPKPHGKKYENKKPESKIRKGQEIKQAEFSDLEVKNPSVAENSHSKSKNKDFEFGFQDIEIKDSKFSDFKDENPPSSGNPKLEIKNIETGSELLKSKKELRTHHVVNSVKNMQTEEIFGFENKDLQRKVQNLENQPEPKSLIAVKTQDDNFDTIPGFTIEKAKSISKVKVDNLQTEIKVRDIEKENLHSDVDEIKISKLSGKRNTPKSEAKNVKSQVRDFETEKSQSKFHELEYENLNSKDQIVFENSNLPLAMNPKPEVKNLKPKAKVSEFDIESPSPQSKEKNKINALESIFSEAGSITSV